MFTRSHRTTTTALIVASLALATPALAQDAEPVEPVDEVEAIEPAEPAKSVAVSGASNDVTSKRTGGDDADVSVQGESDRTVWAAGRSVNIEATSPDAIAAGERVTMRGAVLDNFVGAGQSVSVKGPVGGDVFLLGETLELGSDVAGDVYALGESLLIPDDVEVGGNVYFGGARLDMEGTVLGSILGGGAMIDIDGSVAGDVQLEAADVRVGPKASIGGDLTYESPDKGDVSDEASIAGKVDWTEKTDAAGHGEDSDGSDFGGGLAWRVGMFLASLLVGGALLGLFPKVLKRPAQLLEDEAPVSLGVGFAVLLGVPVLAVFLALFVLPIPLSLLALGVYFPATILARYVAAYALGWLILERMNKSPKPLGALVAGLAVLHLAYAVPLVGGLVLLVATVIGLGALFLTGRRAAGQTATA